MEQIEDFNCSEDFGAGGDYDACIKPIISALNKAGIKTVASCCGHGKICGSIVLKDGRVLLITKEPEIEPEGWNELSEGLKPACLTHKGVSNGK